MIAALFSAVALVATPPQADDATRRDIQCLVALGLALSGDSDQKMAALIAAQYYLGRIDGRAPDLDLEEAVAAEVPAMNEEHIARIIPICGSQMKARGDALREIGSNLMKRGE